MGDNAGIIRPFNARIDLGCVRHNVRFLKSLVRPGCGLMAVVKANAYGHGDIEVSASALEAGADCLGVALVEEAVRLRNAGFECPLFVLFEPPRDAAALIIEHRLTCAVYTPEMAEALSGAAAAGGQKAHVHIKVDTGMRRVGVYPEDVGGFTALLARLPGIVVDGIYTHFAMAADPSDRFTEKQVGLFETAASRAQELLGRPLVRHAASSAGVMAFPKSHYDMVRPGIAIYGLSPSAGMPHADGLRPALSLGGAVALVKKVCAGEGISYGLTFAPERDTWIATLPFGYADGFSRLLTGKAEVIIEGIRRPVVGVICMDMCMVDLGPRPVPPGARFVVIGSQGTEKITADEVAGRLGTINYEVTCMISSRVPRVHVDGDSRGEIAR